MEIQTSMLFLITYSVNSENLFRINGYSRFILNLDFYIIFLANLKLFLLKFKNQLQFNDILKIRN